MKFNLTLDAGPALQTRSMDELDTNRQDLFVASVFSACFNQEATDRQI